MARHTIFVRFTFLILSLVTITYLFEPLAFYLVGKLSEAEKHCILEMKSTNNSSQRQNGSHNSAGGCQVCPLTNPYVLTAFVTISAPLVLLNTEYFSIQIYATSEYPSDIWKPPEQG